MKIYTVTMYRYGDRDRHSYVLGVFTDKKVALETADDEVTHRHCNYLPHVQEWEVNTKRSKTVLALPNQSLRLEERFIDYERRCKAESKP